MDEKKIDNAVKLFAILLFVCFFCPLYSLYGDTIIGISVFEYADVGGATWVLLMLIPLAIFFMVQFKYDKKNAFIISAILAFLNLIAHFVLNISFLDNYNEVSKGFGYTLSMMLSSALIVMCIYGYLTASRMPQKPSNRLAINPAGFCVKCGNPLEYEDVFCPKCGKPIEAEAPKLYSESQKVDMREKEEWTSGTQNDISEEEGTGTRLIIQQGSDDKTMVLNQSKKPYLVLRIKNDHNENEVEISKFPCILGRAGAEAADIFIEDPSVSRSHLSFDLMNHDVIVQDLNSSNGVAINEVVIEPSQPVTISVNDSILIGKTEVKVIAKGEK